MNQTEYCPWADTSDNNLKRLSTSRKNGLTEQEAKNRLDQYGFNQLKEIKKRSVFSILTSQFKSLIVLLLVVAAAVSFGFGEWIEGIAIFVVIFINAAIGFFTELRAVQSMEALKKLSGLNVRVRRRGRLQEISAEQLVPGDIVMLEGGDLISADMRILQGSRLQTDESALTGESLAVSKNETIISSETPLAERSNMLYKGTAVTRGSGEALVIGTGMQTELGKISRLLEDVQEEITPLEKRLNQLANKLIWVTLVIAVLITVSGLFAGKELFLMIETGIALAVAAIPEGLPIVATIALARGMWRMAKHNAIINRLSAVETLGATTIICTDKTGTLTKNRMSVAQINTFSGEFKIQEQSVKKGSIFINNKKSIDPSSDKLLLKALETGMLCNNAFIQENSDSKNAIGDPLESALLIGGEKAGLRQSDIVKKYPKLNEEAFDSETKMMATYHHKQGNEFLVAVKGAPENILQICTNKWTETGVQDWGKDEKKQWIKKNEEIGKQGLRVLGLAEKTIKKSSGPPYQDLHFIGLVGLLDPPRSDVKKAIHQCHTAGIRVIMVTGDQQMTAVNIAEQVGLNQGDRTMVIHGSDVKTVSDMSATDKKKMLQTNIFTRMNPKQKLDLIDLHQKNGNIVAMTGDGVNDAPALKEADIGVAMGLRGTQVAREAADMVLKDDAFPTIVHAIEQGRIIFGNIRKAIVYLLSCNISEVFSVGLASMVNAPLPVLPLQILFLNLVTDVFPALALSVGEGNPDIMKKPPRDPKEPIISRKSWKETFQHGTTMTIAVLGALVLATRWLHLPENKAVTVSFLTLALSQLWHVFNMREHGSHFIKNEIVKNPFIWIALLICIGLVVAACTIPVLSDVLKITNPGLKGWLLVIGMSLLPLIVGQCLKKEKIQ